MRAALVPERRLGDLSPLERMALLGQAGPTLSGSANGSMGGHQQGTRACPAA